MCIRDRGSGVDCIESKCKIKDETSEDIRRTLINMTPDQIIQDQIRDEKVDLGGKCVPLSLKPTEQCAGEGIIGSGIRCDILQRVCIQNSKKTAQSDSQDTTNIPKNIIPQIFARIKTLTTDLASEKNKDPTIVKISNLLKAVSYTHLTLPTSDLV